MIRAVIADDEPLARERIRELLASRDDVQVVAEARDGEEALRVVQSTGPDLLFLDIQMPAMDGFEVLSMLDGTAMPAIVFVTAYDEYAVRAFEVNALDYLVKPFNRARFDSAVERALSRTKPASRYATRFAVRTPTEIYFIRAADVLLIESAGNYVKMHTKSDEHLVRGTLRDIEERLDPEQFVRIHRSAIVALDAVQKLEPYFHGEYVVTLRNGKQLTSSRSYSARLRALL